MADSKEIIVVNELDAKFKEEVASQPGGENIKRCFACGTCAASCPVTDIDDEYNCRKIIRQVLFGMRKEVLSSPTIWYCLVCYRCYARCPQKVNFTDVMRVLRYMAIKGKHVNPDILQMLEKADRFSQEIRHDLVKYTFEQKKEALDKLKAKVSEFIKE